MAECGMEVGHGGAFWGIDIPLGVRDRLCESQR